MNITVNKSLKTIVFSLAIVATTSFKPVAAQNNEFVPEIGWASRLSSMGLDNDDNLGKEYKFECQAAPEDLIHAPIWGTNVYTVNSGLCTTAVHSGFISPEKGGEITVQLLEGKDFYTGSQKNDVISKDHRSTDIGYTFVGEKVAENDRDAESSEDKRQPSGIEKALMEGLQRGVERSIENTIINILK